MQGRLRVVILVHAEVVPPHPRPLGASLHNVYKAVARLATIVIEQFRVTAIAFKKLIAEAGSIGQLHPRVITRFVTKNNLVRVALPGDDNGVVGIQVRMRRAGLEFALVTADIVVAHFHGRNSAGLR